MPVMLFCACAYGVKSEISLVSSDSASSPVVERSVLCAFFNQRCAESVCLCCGLRVCGQKHIILYVTVCEKVVPRLNQHAGFIE